MADVPHFQHDCDECVFLGHHHGHDLYFCNKSVATLIARYGDEGEDYASGLPLVPFDTNLYEAEQRAKKQGLL